MTERRYREDEVREIFGQATRQGGVDLPTPSPANGLTLADLQSIGLEVGLQPDVVARAAAALDVRVTTPPRTALGMPIEVGRTVQLPRALTDKEWEQLVVELRTTFRAKGRITTHGGLREWANGNLHACIEPVQSGYRLRLGTLKSNAWAVNALGLTALAAGAITLLSAGPEGLLAPMLLGASGIGAFVANWLRLPRWAKEREQQMEHIAATVQSTMQAKAEG